MNTTNCLFKWTLGIQDTVSLTDFDENQFVDMVWLSKLSILSFQKWFPEAEFILLFNGYDFKSFYDLFFKTDPQLIRPLLVIDQRHPHVHPEKFANPYHFVPVSGGVWMKWIPFRYDISKTEIAVDTDIICIGEPKDWYAWLKSDELILIAPERYENVRVNTCGDFYKHPILQGKKPFNCGVVGQRSGHDFSERFFEITKEVKYGSSHDSLFITEQGAINVWVRSLELDGTKTYALDFKRNAWMRDFLYFLKQGVEVETVHAVSWHKKIASQIKEVLERRVLDDSYSNAKFVADVLNKAEHFNALSRHIITRQISPEDEMKTEFLLS